MYLLRFIFGVAFVVLISLVAIGHCQRPATTFAVPFDSIPSTTKIVEPDGTSSTIRAALDNVESSIKKLSGEVSQNLGLLRSDLDDLSQRFDQVAATQESKIEPVPDPEFRELAGDDVTENTPESSKVLENTDANAPENGVLDVTSKILNSPKTSDSSPPEKCCPDCLCKRSECNCDHPGACIEAWAKANGLVRVHVQGNGEVRKYGAETGKGVLLTPDGHHYRSEWLPESYSSGAAPSPDAELMFAAGRTIGAQSILTGTLNSILQEAADKQAKYQASVDKQGHFGYEHRIPALMAQLPGYEISEIVAESWPGQFGEAGAASIFKSWRDATRGRLEGHWGIANWPNVLYGYSMAASGTKEYGCGICARRNASFGQSQSTPRTYYQPIYQGGSCANGSCSSGGCSGGNCRRGMGFF